MNDEELIRIETELSVSLPHLYRRILLEEAFADDSVAECMLISEPDRLTAMNRPPSDPAHRRPRKNKKSPPPTLQEGSFRIGSDGSELWYYLDLNSGVVLQYDLETGSLDPYAATIEDYITKLRDIDRELAEEDDDLTPISKWESFVSTAKTLFWVFLVIFVVLPAIAFTVQSCGRWVLGR